MPIYILNKNSQPTWEHEVHNIEECSKWHLPEIENRINIWEFENCTKAIEYLRFNFPDLKVDGCYWCTNCHTK
jgi:hypothetical protein